MFPTYEASRKAIKQLLKIDENSLEELGKSFPNAELLAEDKPLSGWFAPSDTESVAKVEEGEVVPPKDMRRINEENQKATIVIDEAPKKTQTQTEAMHAFSPQRRLPKNFFENEQGLE